MKWRIESGGKIYDPGESTVVFYDPRSGDTHLLSAFAAHVLRQFGDREWSAEELAERVAPSLEAEQIHDLPETLTGLLQELVALDILAQT